MSQPNKEEALQYAEEVSKPTIWGSRKRRGEVVLEKIETESEKQLKDQIKKQLCTDVTLQSELSKRKSFTGASVHEPIKLSGELSLDKYQGITQEAARIEQLRNYQLTEEEIQIKLSQENGKVPPLTGFGADPLVKQTALKAINEKIEKHERRIAESSNFSGAKKLSRHEMDLERALIQSRDKEEAKMLGMLVSEKHLELGKSSTGSGHIKDMLAEIDRKIHRVVQSESETSDESPVQSETETKIPEGSVLSVSTNCEECDKLRTKDRYFVGPLLKTDYDYYEKCDHCKQLKNKEFNENQVNSQCINVQQKSNPRKKKARKKKKKHKNKGQLTAGADGDDNQGVTTEDNSPNVEDIPIEAIVKYRLTPQQIREIPRFANHTCGDPHHTLYVKNLADKVTVGDLRSLFSRFRPVQYRLLGGRMRGQAFVTFSDIQSATEALELVHGYQFKGKPVIIQYGKKQM